MKFPRRKNFFAYLIFIILLGSCKPINSINNTVSAPTMLLVNNTLEQTIEGDNKQIFGVILKANECARIVFTQRSTDIVLNIIDPNGKTLFDNYDTRLGVIGTERIIIVATIAGKYTISVSPNLNTRHKGKYNVNLEGIRVATNLDKDDFKAEEIFSRAKTLYDKHTEAGISSSLSLFNESYKIWEKLDYKFGQSVCENYISNIKIMQHKANEALPLVTHGLFLARVLKDKQLECNLLDGVAQANWESGNREMGIAQEQEAIEIAREVNEFLGEVYITNNLGIMTEGSTRLQYLEAALAKATLLTDNEVTNIIRMNLGQDYMRKGNLQKALFYIDQALDEAKKFSLNRVTASSKYTKSQICLLLGERQLAKQFIQESLDENILETKSRSELMLAKLYATDNLEKSIDLAKKVLNENQLQGQKNEELQALIYLGQFYCQANDITNGIQCFRRVIEDADKNKLIEISGFGHLQLGKKLADMGEYEQALNELNISLAIFDKLEMNTEKIEILYELAKIFKSKHELVKGLTYIEKSIDLIENVRTSSVAPLDRADWFSQIQKSYDLGINLCMDEYSDKKNNVYLSKAIKYSESGRCRSLLDTIYQTNISKISPLDYKNLIAQRDSVRKSINEGLQQEIELLNQKNLIEVNKLEKLIQQQKLQYRDIENKIELQTQALENNSINISKSLDLPGIQNMIDNNTIVLEYKLFENKSFLFAITKERVLPYTLPGNSEIEPIARELYKTISDKTSSPNDYMTASKSLTKLILPNEIDKKKIVVVADGVLQYIPFSVLTSKNQFMIESHEIYSLPSITLVSALRKKEKNHITYSKEVAVIGDPIFNGNDERVSNKTGENDTFSDIAENNSPIDSKVLHAERNIHLGRLVYAKSELEAIKSLFPNSDIFSDFNANKINLSKLAQNYKIVHFATHGFFNTLHPELSALVLSTINEKGDKIDGIVTADDIYGLHISAELVVLSACDTGLGKDLKGEGILGLTRGFTATGSKNIISTLWNINDRSTLKIMETFYKNLLTSPVEPAMRVAQIELLSNPNFSHPYYWAGFTLQGDWANDALPH